MTEKSPKPVVVAVGHDPFDGALAFAVAEATRAGCGVRLVHAVNHLPVGPRLAPPSDRELEEAGRQVLDAAYEHARGIVGAVPLTTDLHVGGVVPGIIEMAEDARMIVLERRDLAAVKRIVTSSKSTSVAARARVPVVSVPSGWSSDSTGVVTVGIDSPERSDHVLRAAIAEARERGATLRVLHAWSPATTHANLVMSWTGDETWVGLTGDQLRTTIDELGDEVADLPLEIEVRALYPADALHAASKRSDLVVLGRHDPLLPLGSHLGPIARAVLREAECPVMLVDPGSSRRWKRRSWHASQASPTA